MSYYQEVDCLLEPDTCGVIDSLFTTERSGQLTCCLCDLQHWIANNLFGLAFALNGVELLHLNNVSTGCILLGGLFVYDVFWVSGFSIVSLLVRPTSANV